jgi:hypothetical protein
VKDFSAKAEQTEDGSFVKLPYGKTIFCGQSVRQRETLVSRVLTISILVEGIHKQCLPYLATDQMKNFTNDVICIYTTIGGPGAAHEAEEFTWNDHTVIPIVVTGGAAGGSFGVPSTIFQVSLQVAKFLN